MNNKLLKEWLAVAKVSFLFLLLYAFTFIISGTFGSDVSTMAELIKSALNLNALFYLIGFFIEQTIFFFVVFRVFNYFTTTPFIYKKASTTSRPSYKKLFEESPFLWVAVIIIMFLVIIGIVIG